MCGKRLVDGLPGAIAEQVDASLEADLPLLKVDGSYLGVIEQLLTIFSLVAVEVSASSNFFYDLVD